MAEMLLASATGECDVPSATETIVRFAVFGLFCLMQGVNLGRLIK